MQRAKKNYLIYAVMLLLFGVLIYMAIEEGDRFSHHAVASSTVAEDTPFTMFCQFVTDNLHHPLSILLIQIIAVLLMVRLFGFLFKHIGQPGVIGEIVAGIVLGPSVLGYFFPDVFQALFPPESLTNLELLSQVGLVLFMFVIGMELDFSVLKNKINETLVISHAGILVPFFLGIVASYWIYEEYAAAQTAFLPFALFIGISMSITAFPVLARIIQERNMTKTSLGTLAIASAANDDVTAWCLLAVVIAIAKAGTFASALYAIGLTALYIIIMFMVVRPFLKKVGEVYANQEVINKTFVALILLILIISSTLTEIIGIHALFGAFMAGVVMPPSIGFRKVMMEKVEDIALVFFSSSFLCLYRIAYRDRIDQQSGALGCLPAADYGCRSRKTGRMCCCRAFGRRVLERQFYYRYADEYTGTDGTGGTEYRIRNGSTSAFYLCNPRHYGIGNYFYDDSVVTPCRADFCPS